MSFEGIAPADWDQLAHFLFIIEIQADLTKQNQSTYSANFRHPMGFGLEIVDLL